MAVASKERGVQGAPDGIKQPPRGKRAAVLGVVPGLKKVPPVADFIRTHRRPPPNEGLGKPEQIPVVSESSKSFVEKEFSPTSLLEIDEIFAKAQLAVPEKVYMGNYPDQLITAREALRKVQIDAKMRVGRNGAQKDGNKQVQVGLFEGRKNDFAEIMFALGAGKGVFNPHNRGEVKSDVVKIGEASNIQTFMRGVCGKAIEYKVGETPYISFDIIFSPEVLAAISQSEMLPPLPVKKVVNSLEADSRKPVFSR